MLTKLAEKPKTLRLMLSITSLINSSKKDVKSITVLEVYRFYFIFLSANLRE
jgi:hypothetical protein